MKVWFPEYYTEAHREQWMGEDLVRCLHEEGVDCVLHLTSDCDLIFCGGFIRYRNCIFEAKKFSHIPVVHYNWDLYPFLLTNNPDPQQQEWWKEYINEMKTCRMILVPSTPVIARTKEFVGRDDAVICKAPIHPWEPTGKSTYEPPYVMDVMRRYSWDPNWQMAQQTCRELGIKMIDPGCGLPWDEFKNVVAGATLLISAYHEASTGGLTLLEGLYHGVSSLCAASPYNGVNEYMQDKAAYFQWDNRHEFRLKLQQMFKKPPKYSLPRTRQWIEEQYGERAFAKRLAACFRKALEQ